MPDSNVNIYEPDGYPGYFIAKNKVIQPKTFMLKTTEKIRSRAGEQGAEIGRLGSTVAGAVFVVDWNENDLGCVRIAKLIGAPFPDPWIKALKKLGYTQNWSWEAWVDKSRLIAVAQVVTNTLKLLTTIDLETSVVTTEIIK